MSKLKYKGKLKALREHAKEINGLLVVPRSWVIMVLSASQLRKFERKFVWKKELMKCECIICPTCKNSIPHLHPKKYKRHAYFWDLEKVVNQ